MEEIKLMLFLFLAFVLVVVAPIAISYFLYRWLTKSRFKKYALIFPVVIVGSLIFFIYTAFYPTDSFYEDEFEYNTGIKLPPSADILDKDASYPDQHGDYWSAAIIQLNESDYSKLKTELSKATNFEEDTTQHKIGVTTDYIRLTDDIKKNEIQIVYSNKKEQWFKIAFLTDKKRIIFERASS